MAVRILLVFLFCSSFVRSQAIGNDDFSKAPLLSEKLPLKVKGRLADETGKVFATREVGEFRHGGRSCHGSVWYRWKSKTARRVEVVVESERVGLVLAVYTGFSVSNLKLVHRYRRYAFPAFSRKRTEPFAMGARVEFNAAAGQEYYFAIDSENRVLDAFELRVREIPDLFEPEEELLAPGDPWEHLFPLRSNGDAYDPEEVDDDFDSTWMKPDRYDGPEFRKPSPSPIGFGEITHDPIRTYLEGSEDYLPKPEHRNAIYLRTKITPRFDVSSLAFEGIVDDGAIIYVNGSEVARINVKDDVDASDWKARAINAKLQDRQYDTEAIVQYAVAKGLFLPKGEPADVAVSLHGNQSSTSDAGINLRIYAVE